MADATWAAQQAVYAAAVAALTPVAVFDRRAPAGTARPYAVIGETTARPAGTKTEDGEEVTITVHFWSDYRGSKEVKGLRAKLRAALHDGAPAAAGFAVVLCREDFFQDFDDADGLSVHGIARYRLMLEPA